MWPWRVVLGIYGCAPHIYLYRCTDGCIDGWTGGGTVDGVGKVAVLVEQGGDLLHEGGTGRRRRGGGVGIFDWKRRSRRSSRGGSGERGRRRGFVWVEEGGIDGVNGRERSKKISAPFALMINISGGAGGTWVSRCGINWKR